jgi:restriction system protein
VAIPDFQTIMLPQLKLLGDGKEHLVRELTQKLAEEFDLSSEELSELQPSGQGVFYNRAGWARTYLSIAGLIKLSRRGCYRITNLGKDVLGKKPKAINKKYLEQFPAYLKHQEEKKTKVQDSEDLTPEKTGLTPDEIIIKAHREISDALAQQLLTNIKGCSPAFFEKLVIELLVRMGYGGSRDDAARAVGKSGDGGIDGIIDEDRLGLDSIYIQAKRWDDVVVGRPEIQKFVGALVGRQANKGIFITTSTFSETAKKFVNGIEKKVVLIDGGKLAEYMIKYDVGVSLTTSYQIKKIDSDYFTDE